MRPGQISLNSNNLLDLWNSSNTISWHTGQCSAEQYSGLGHRCIWLDDQHISKLHWWSIQQMGLPWTLALAGTALLWTAHQCTAMIKYSALWTLKNRHKTKGRKSQRIVNKWRWAWWCLTAGSINIKTSLSLLALFLWLRTRPYHSSSSNAKTSLPFPAEFLVLGMEPYHSTVYGCWSKSSPLKLRKGEQPSYKIFKMHFSWGGNKTWTSWWKKFLTALSDIFPWSPLLSRYSWITQDQEPVQESVVNCSSFEAGPLC